MVKRQRRWINNNEKKINVAFLNFTARSKDWVLLYYLHFQNNMELILYINLVIHNTKSLLFISLCLTFSIFKEWEEVLNFSKVFPMIINRLSIINCQWIQISYLFISEMFTTDLISPFKLCSFNLISKRTQVYIFWIERVISIDHI